jgi:Diacylglycerol acyltransferase
MISELFVTTFPISYLTLFVGLLIGVGITTAAFGILSAIIFLILLWMDVISIEPILTSLHRFFVFVAPETLEKYKKNLSAMYPVSIHPTTLALGEGGTPKKCIYLWHPHGMFPTAHYFHTVTPCSEFPKTLKPIQSVCIYWAAWLPGFSQIFRSLGVVPSTYNGMKEALSRGANLSVSLGGVREMLYLEKGKLRLCIKEKKGVFRLALEEGATLIPCLSYGQNELFEQVDSPWLERINRHAYEWFKCILPLPRWSSIRRWWDVLSAPPEQKVVTHIGAPIRVDRVVEDEISPKKIAAVREQYFSALKELYAKTRPSFYAEELEFL